MPRVTTDQPLVFNMGGIIVSKCPADGEFMVHPAILKKFRHCLTEVKPEPKKEKPAPAPEPEGQQADTPTEGGDSDESTPKPASKRKRSGAGRRTRKSSGDTAG